MNVTWPGGPHRHSRRTSPGTAPAGPSSLEACRALRDARAERRRRRRRRVRAWVTGVAVALLATSVGYGLGKQVERSAADVAAHHERRNLAQEGSGLDRLLGGQADRVIQQMWLTEFAEAQMR